MDNKNKKGVSRLQLALTILAVVTQVVFINPKIREFLGAGEREMSSYIFE